MKSFLDRHFLLNSNTAIELFKNAAESLPIFDFHCHLDPREIWENTPYPTLTQVWLRDDHYKWRTMRMHGIGEKFITGDASDWEKFLAWVQTLQHLIGNPLYHWTHMELSFFFGIEKRLTPETARDIYEECNEKLQRPEFRPRALIERSNVKFIGTTDDPISTLDYHQSLNRDPSITVKIAPTFRPDGALFIERPTFKNWIEKLTQVSGINTDSLDGLLSALKQRVDFFHVNGSRASDHDIQELDYVESTKEEINRIFKKRLAEQQLSNDEVDKFRCFLLKELGQMYAEKQWVMQLHMGAMRNNNTKMMGTLGKDTGFDSVGEANFAGGLSRFLDSLDQLDALPRTVLYNLNPKDNAVLASMIGNFYEEGVPGKIQFGSGWWFNDQIDGIEKQMKDLANAGLLSHFIGMLTDSRSFLSYVRHDYFRRILCNLLGDWVERGLAPNDKVLLEEMVTNISYKNAERFFLER